MTEVDKERLRRFFGGYFHQDWNFDAPDDKGVVDLYIADFPEHGALTTLAAELDALSNAYATDSELEAALLSDFWCDGYVPSLVGLSASAWVRTLAERLRAASSG